MHSDGPPSGGSCILVPAATAAWHGGLGNPCRWWRGRTGLEEAVAAGVGGGLDPVACADLGVDVRQMPLNGLRTEDERGSYLGVGGPARQQPEYRYLPRGQPVGMEGEGAAVRGVAGVRVRSTVRWRRPIPCAVAIASTRSSRALACCLTRHWSN